MAAVSPVLTPELDSASMQTHDRLHRNRNSISISSSHLTDTTTTSTMTSTTTTINCKPITLALSRLYMGRPVVMLTLAVLLMGLYAGQVSSLKCYHCSSVDNPGCDESFTGKANITDTDCSQHISQPAKVCRKIVQYIEHKKVVIRSCGYIDDHEGKDKKPMCYKRSGTFAIMMESCNCFEDYCNHSASLVPNQSVLIAAILGSLLASSIITITTSYNTNNHYRDPRS